MSDSKKNKSHSEAIHTESADKKRLLEALQKLQAQGIRIIDDCPGRAQIIPAPDYNKDYSRRSSSPVYTDLESLFQLEDQVGSDPYNKFFPHGRRHTDKE